MSARPLKLWPLSRTRGPDQRKRSRGEKVADQNTITVQRIGARFVARASFEQREIPKAAGFRWDPAARQWWTASADIAAKLGSPEAIAEAVAKKAAADEAKTRQIEASKAADFAGEIPVPEGLAYLPYQRAGIAYGINLRENLGVLLADEMGLGKTIQAIGILNTDLTLQRVLIVCPASLRLNWQRELRKWLVRPMRSEIATSTWFPTGSGIAITIMNYDIAAKHMAAMRRESWDAVILDEAHYLKNPTTKRTIALFGRNRKGEDTVEPVNGRRRMGADRNADSKSANRGATDPALAGSAEYPVFVFPIRETLLQCSAVPVWLGPERLIESAGVAGFAAVHDHGAAPEGRRADGTAGEAAGCWWNWKPREPMEPWRPRWTPGSGPRAKSLACAFA